MMFDLLIKTGYSEPFGNDFTCLNRGYINQINVIGGVI